MNNNVVTNLHIEGGTAMNNVYVITGVMRPMSSFIKSAIEVSIFTSWAMCANKHN